MTRSLPSHDYHLTTDAWLVTIGSWAQRAPSPESPRSSRPGADCCLSIVVYCFCVLSYGVCTFTLFAAWGRIRLGRACHRKDVYKTEIRYTCTLEQLEKREKILRMDSKWARRGLYYPPRLGAYEPHVGLAASACQAIGGSWWWFTMHLVKFKLVIIYTRNIRPLSVTI